MWLCDVMFLQNLRDILTDQIPREQKRVVEFKKAHGSTKIGEVTVDQVCTKHVYHVICRCEKCSDENYDNNDNDIMSVIEIHL